MNLRPALVLPLLSVLFAGCVGGGSTSVGEAQTPPIATGPAEYDDTTGGIEGLVTDEELQPLEGALVALRERPDASATTDVAGHFALSNLEPGAYSLDAQKLGHQAIAKKIEVVAGESTQLQIALPRLAIEEPWVETIVNNGIIRNGVGVIRTATCSNCAANAANKETLTHFAGDELAEDYQGILIESTWQSRDYIGLDFVDRTKGEMYWRIRSQPPVHFLLERCGAYIGAPWFGRNPMPCEESNVTESKVWLENWYIGEFQAETHTLDEACKVPILPPPAPTVVPGYIAGCYGLGFVVELKFTNYVSVFHLELPDEADTFSAMPDA